MCVDRLNLPEMKTVNSIILSIVVIYLKTAGKLDFMSKSYM